MKQCQLQTHYTKHIIRVKKITQYIKNIGRFVINYSTVINEAIL